MNVQFVQINLWIIIWSILQRPTFTNLWQASSPKCIFWSTLSLQRSISKLSSRWNKINSIYSFTLSEGANLGWDECLLSMSPEAALDQSFSMYAKFSKKLTFLRKCSGGKKSQLFGKFFVHTKWMIPLENQRTWGGALTDRTTN